MNYQGTYRCDNCETFGEYYIGTFNKDAISNSQKYNVSEAKNKQQDAEVAAYPIYCEDCMKIGHTNGYEQPFKCLDCQSKNIKILGNDTMKVVIEQKRKNHLASWMVEPLEICPICYNKKLAFSFDTLTSR